MCLITWLNWLAVSNKRVCDGTPFLRVSWFHLATSLVIGCAPQSWPDPATDDLTAYKLCAAFAQRPLVESSIQLCNRLLPANAAFVFTAGWEPRATAAQMPVYLVDGQGLRPTDMIFVPDGENFVIVNEDALLKFFQRTEMKPNTWAPVLALLLLHEAGHKTNGDSGSFVGTEPIGTTNLIDSASKKRETAADAFAANAIREGLTPTAKPSAFSAAGQISTALMLHQFNVASRRLLDNFGRRSPEPFLDRGYSHPNYERRLLIMIDAISPSDESRKLLSEFDAQRSVRSQPIELFRRATAAP